MYCDRVADVSTLHCVVGLCLILCCIFFFKQKTAYEMRISDWSSDVCSSDLMQHGTRVAARQGSAGYLLRRSTSGVAFAVDGLELLKIGRASCRDRVCQYV